MTGRTKGPTQAQGEVLAFIASFTGHKGYPPTRTEICAKFGWRSPNAAQAHIQRLVAKGLLIVDRRVSRGLRIVESA